MPEQSEHPDEIARALPLSEAAGLPGPKFKLYLREMCHRYAGRTYSSQHSTNPALALPYADALVTACPDEDEGREIRAYCLAHLTPVNYAALLRDYEWLARRPLRGSDYWSVKLRHLADDDPEHYEYLIDHAAQEELYRRTHFCLASAWACYHLNDLAGAAEAFDRAFLRSARDDFGFDPEWPVDLLPPVPDPGYLNWQISRQMQDDKWKTASEAVRDWLGLALRMVKTLQT